MLSPETLYTIVITRRYQTLSCSRQHPRPQNLRQRLDLVQKAIPRLESL